MLFLIWGILIVCGLLFPKSKAVSVMMVAFMVIVIGFRTQGADYYVYLNEYTWSEYQTVADVHYVGYLILEQWAHQQNILFNQLLLLVGSASCFLLYFGLSHLTPYVNTALALFFVYPFSHEAVQTRTFLANSVLIAAMPLILKDGSENPRTKWLSKWIRTILFFAIAALSCTFHFEAAIYAVLLALMLFLPPKYGRSFIIISTVIAFGLIEGGILPKIVERFNSRIAYWLSGKTELGIVIPIFITLVIWYAMQVTGKICVCNCPNGSTEQRLYERILRFSDFIFFLIPLFCYDITFNRLWRLFLLLFYIMVAKAFPRKMSKNSRLWIILLITVLFVSVCIYEGVFVLLQGVFENNAVFGSLAVI